MGRLIKLMKVGYASNSIKTPKGKMITITNKLKKMSGMAAPTSLLLALGCEQKPCIYIPGYLICLSRSADVQSMNDMTIDL